MKKNLTKKVFAGLMATSMLALTACGGSSSSATTAAPAADTKAEETTAAEAKTENSEAAAEDTGYPNGTINIVCHAAAGGGSDSMSRELAQLMQEEQGWTVTVDNRTGGSGSVGVQYVMNSKPDGYTIGTAPVELSMIKALGYADITPDSVQLIGCTMHWPAALYVAKDAPYDDFQGFVDYCKEHPGELSVANSGIGSIWHIAACVVADKTGININYVPYDGAQGAITALLGKEVGAAIVGSSEGYTYVESGDVKCIAVFGEEESDVLPGVKTAKDQGYDINVNCWVGLLAPKGISDEVLNKLVAATKEACESDDYQEFCAGRGCDGSFYGPEEFLKMANDDTEYYAKLISDLGIVTQ